MSKYPVSRTTSAIMVAARVKGMVDKRAAMSKLSGVTKVGYPVSSEREPNGQTAIPHKACKHIKKPEIGFRRLTLVELSRNVMGPDGPHGQNGTIRSGHGSGDNTNETPGAQEGVGFVRQEFDKRLGIRNPFTTSRKSQNCGTSVGRELGVDRVWTIVKAD